MVWGCAGVLLEGNRLVFLEDASARGRVSCGSFGKCTQPAVSPGAACGAVWPCSSAR